MTSVVAPTAPTRLRPTRLRIEIRGLVQGVGFRPHVYKIASAHRVAGWVRNDQAGVTIEAEAADLDGFLADLVGRAPAIARIESLASIALPPQGTQGFAIIPSQRTGPALTGIGADLPVCPDCLAELFDPADRRYRYPFLSCTACGPRYSVTARLPYDRANTALADFPLCPDCAAEYADPAGRRFHAEPMACPACGPRLSMPVAESLQRLRDGEILAIKGIGGFHLACDARNREAVARLRARKRRDEKPFAVMLANIASVRRWAVVDETAAALLTQPARPVVILPALGGLSAGVGVGLGTLGVMLPYAPLHWLLFHAAAGYPDGGAWCAAPQDLCLVMTSANRAGEPIVIDDADAATRLAGIADAVAGHDRPILARADDSVVRPIAGGGVLLRRARGWVPTPIPLARPLPPLLAVGGGKKVTICLTRGAEAFLSTHIGDLDTPLGRDFFVETVARMQDLLEIAPQAVIHDLHPDFFTTRWAEESGLPCLAVPHHAAHLAALAAEHRITGPLTGLILDGYGMGSDGGAWGGELLHLVGRETRRLGHFAELALPGGDQAARAPWRMAAAALYRMGRGAEIPQRFAAQPGAAVVARMLAGGGVPLTSSAGRWFDAAAGLLGLADRVTDEALSAMRLESRVTAPESLPDGWRVRDGVLDLTPLLAALDPADPVGGANLFHGTLAAALVDWVVRVTEPGARVALGGGCFVNRWLAEAVVTGLAAVGRTALLPRLAPAGDGGLALGQAWLGGLLLSDPGPAPMISVEGDSPCA